MEGMFYFFEKKSRKKQPILLNCFQFINLFLSRNSEENEKKRHKKMKSSKRAANETIAEKGHISTANKNRYGKSKEP